MKAAETGLSIPVLTYFNICVRHKIQDAIEEVRERREEARQTSVSRLPVPTRSGVSRPANASAPERDKDVYQVARESGMSLEDMLYLSHGQVEKIMRGQGCSVSLRRVLLKQWDAEKALSMSKHHDHHVAIATGQTFEVPAASHCHPQLVAPWH
jgi:hypothetical protein